MLIPLLLGALALTAAADRDRASCFSNADLPFSLSGAFFSHPEAYQEGFGLAAPSRAEEVVHVLLVASHNE
jgi:hypothetical protein